MVVGYPITIRLAIQLQVGFTTGNQEPVNGLPFHRPPCVRRMKSARTLLAMLMISALAAGLQARPLIPFRQLLDDFEPYLSTN